MNVQQDLISLHRQRSEQDKLVHDLSVSADGGSALESFEESIPVDTDDCDRATLEQLVGVRTNQLEAAVKDLNETQTALLHAQKMEAVGQLAAGMAHEINTPMHYIGGNLEFMKQAFDQLSRVAALAMNVIEEQGLEGHQLEDHKRKLEFILARLPSAVEQSIEGVATVSSIVSAMKRFSHLAEERVTADINEAITSTLTVSKGEWKYLADVNCELDPKLPELECLPGELNQAFLNMIVNAAHAIEEKIGSNSDEKGVISISTSFDDNDIRVSIADTGAGIPDSVVDRIFDPFFTTKQIGKGTGQGLSICRSIFVDKHGGRMNVESTSGEGTVFTIWLPRDWAPDNASAQQT